MTTDPAVLDLLEPDELPTNYRPRKAKLFTSVPYPYLDMLGVEELQRAGQAHATV
jgi:hypothetical protein